MNRSRIGLMLLLGATAACAAVLGIEDTTDEAPVSVDGGAADAAVDVDPGAIEPPPIDASETDLSNLDAGVVPPCTEPGLVARWKLDEGTGTVVSDCSGSELHGKASSGTAWTAGVDGGAMLFSGGWVGFGNKPALHIVRDLTLSAWIRSDRAIADTEYVVGRTKSPADHGWRIAVLSGRTLALATPNGGSVNAVGGEIPLRTWVHVAGVFRPSVACEVYVDGALVGRRGSNVPAATKDTDDEVRIGARSDGTSPFGGAIDDVRVYNRALSAAEIAALAKR